MAIRLGWNTVLKTRCEPLWCRPQCPPAVDRGRLCHCQSKRAIPSPMPRRNAGWSSRVGDARPRSQVHAAPSRVRSPHYTMSERNCGLGPVQIPDSGRSIEGNASAVTYFDCRNQYAEQKDPPPPCPTQPLPLPYYSWQHARRWCV